VIRVDTAYLWQFLMFVCLMNKCSAVAEMGDRLATIDMGRKLGGGLCPYGGKLNPM